MVALTIPFTLRLLPEAFSLYFAETTSPISSEYLSGVISVNLLSVSVKSLHCCPPIYTETHLELVEFGVCLLATLFKVLF